MPPGGGFLLMDKPLQILSLGGGVQSTVVFLMSCIGELPRLDHSLFADTKWEPPWVYDHLCWLRERAAEFGIPLTTVSAGNLREHAMEGIIRGNKGDGERYASMPLRILNPDSSQIMIRRQCTREYKIDPIDRFIRYELLGLKKGQHAPRKCVDMWFGISADELRRVRTSQVHWKDHVYPLVGLPNEMLPKPYHRSDCIEWLRSHYPGHIVRKSACIGCPFRDNIGWAEIKADPQTWADAVEVDEAVRHADQMGGTAYLHKSYKPLAEAGIGEYDHDNPQMELFSCDDDDDMRQECTGYCGD